MTTPQSDGNGSIPGGTRGPIVTADCGQDALRQVLRHDFAVILLDVRMPRVDGFEAAELIRQREQSRHTPIIFFSAVDKLDEDVFRGLASGAVDYLFKPVVPEVLQSKVSVFVDLYRMRERVKLQAIRPGRRTFPAAGGQHQRLFHSPAEPGRDDHQLESRRPA